MSILYTKCHHVLTRATQSATLLACFCAGCASAAVAPATPPSLSAEATTMVKCLPREFAPQLARACFAIVLGAVFAYTRTFARARACTVIRRARWFMLPAASTRLDLRQFQIGL